VLEEEEGVAEGGFTLKRHRLSQKSGFRISLSRKEPLK
jgi:hypothetical protein